MKSPAALLLALCTALPAARGGAASPIGKVLQLLTDLHAKITAEGAEAEKDFAELSEWCEDRSKNLAYEIKTGKSEAASLTAAIQEEEALSASLQSKIEALAADIATDEADKKAATQIRTKESADFAAEQKELGEVIDTLERAISVLEREMAKGGAALLELRGLGGVARALELLVSASTLGSADGARLSALVQASQGAEAGEAEDEAGAPAAAAYESHSGGIVETLEGLLEKAKAQLEEARKRETAALHSFQQLKQSIEDSIAYANKELAEAKQGLAKSGEKKATAEGDLGATTKALEADKASLGDLKQDCLTGAEDHEAATRSRAEELDAISQAKKVLQEETAGAEERAYGLEQLSFAQLSSGRDLAHFEAVRLVRELARRQRSPALAQLAARMSAAVRSGAAAGDDPFQKVKGLIRDMVERLEDEAAADASHKAYCDKELAYASTKAGEKEAEVEKLTASIDQMSAREAQLGRQVVALQGALAALAKSQAEMDALRAKESKDFKKAKADYEQGLEGVKLALKVLSEYYAKGDKAHSAAGGAAGGIIGLLEVVESDFSKGLAELSATEQSAQAAYERETKENEIERAAKEKDVEYKSNEASQLKKAVAEASSDREGVQSELAAVKESLASLEKQCAEKAETFEERKARFAAELAGLREALQILEGETVLLQQASRRTLRGIRPHGAAA